ncbi:MAG: DUF488 domain-containing protein [Caldilineaceae bacterium]|nr:DUF488 domain-containing protein [Caldilineaceae bacterium]MCB0121633.1 DUF488 domain-containing protein [Caldilineaceae bacterium]MCB0186800.1 DUF488 domain-containing protein [Caldilineaceae bacterium]
MTTIHTIGFTKKPLRHFIELLQTAQVDALIDIRLRNTSQLAGWAKRDDLAYVLELVNIAYEHQPELAPTAEILDSYRKDGDWETYVRRFRPLLRERHAQTLGETLLTRYQAPCLLCSEATPEQCHRRLVAEFWQELIPAIQINHL